MAVGEDEHVTGQVADRGDHAERTRRHLVEAFPGTGERQIDQPGSSIRMSVDPLPSCTP